MKRILIQNRKSRQYASNEADWTNCISEAMEFKHVLDAINQARASKSPDLDVVMNFGEPKYDIRIRATE